MGCSGMSGHISKGPVHRAVDWVVNHRDEDGLFDMRQRFLDDLASDRDYFDILDEALRGYLRAEGLPPEKAAERAEVLRKYLFDTWYSGWWTQHQPVLHIVRQGLIKAIRIANLEPPLPIESYWLATGPHDSEDSPFEVIVSRGGHQVTRIILTPESPVRANPNFLEELSDIWVVKRGPAGDWEAEEVGQLGERAVTTRLKAYPLRMPRGRLARMNQGGRYP
jgi:hypothetical protein